MPMRNLNIPVHIKFCSVVAIKKVLEGCAILIGVYVLLGWLGNDFTFPKEYILFFIPFHLSLMAISIVIEITALYLLLYQFW